jgi:hypothetical protein
MRFVLLRNERLKPSIAETRDSVDKYDLVYINYSVSLQKYGIYVDVSGFALVCMGVKLGR